MQQATAEFQLTTESQFMGLPTVASVGCPLRADILQRLHAILVGIAERFGATVFLGFDLHYPNIPPHLTENYLLVHFLQRFLGALKAEPAADIGYAWSRDQLPSQRHQTYRLAFVVGNLPGFDSSRCLLDAANLWCNRIWNVPASHNLLVPWPECGTVLDRSHPAYPPTLGACFQAMSQLARSDTKTMGNGRMHNFGSSRL